MKKHTDIKGKYRKNEEKLYGKYKWQIKVPENRQPQQQQLQTQTNDYVIDNNSSNNKQQR